MPALTTTREEFVLLFTGRGLGAKGEVSGRMRFIQAVVGCVEGGKGGEAVEQEIAPVDSTFGLRL